MDLLYETNGRLRAIWRFCLGLLVFIAAEAVGNAAGAVFFRFHILIAEFLVQAISVTILLGGFTFLLITADHVEEGALASMGLGWSRSTLRQVLAGLGIGVVMVLGCAAVLVVWADDVTLSGHLGSMTMLRAGLALTVLALGAMAEEAAFRGYPFQRLTDAAGPIVAIVVIQIGFGLIHSDNPNVSRWGIANTALFGVLLAVAYLRSRSLWLPWGMHFGWNAMLAVGLGLPLSGLTVFASVLHTRVRGPEWMTGGSYGIEGGALTTVAIIAMSPVVWWLGGRIRHSGSRVIGHSQTLASQGLSDSPITGFPDHPSSGGGI